MRQALLLMFTLAAMTAGAQENDGMFYYAYNDEAKTATVTYRPGGTKGGSYEGDVVIPAKAPNGYDVTIIGGDAFLNSDKMTSLTIPATIDSIGEQPFGNCTAHLTKITIEDGDTPLRCHVVDAWPRGCFPVFGRDVDVEELYIGRNYHSFVSRGWVEAVYEGSWSLIRDSEHLKKVTMGSAFTEVPYGIFYGCKQLETVNFGPNVKSIGESAFGYCESLTSMDLPDGIETIGQSAFAYCKSLERITLPQTLKLICGDVFTNCEQIASITIPASVDSIGCAFNGCKALRSFTVENGDTPLRFWSSHSWAGWSTVFDGMENLETVTMGRPVICDVPSTYYCRNLRKFEYTYPIDEVADKQFYHCTNLRSVIFCGAPARIGKESFRECDSLVSINLPEGVTFIDDHAFYYCPSLEDVGLPSTLRVIGDFAFRRCEKFQQFTVPAQVDSICNGIVNECNNLKKVIIAPSSKPLKYCCPSQFTNSLRSAPIDTLYLDRYIQNGSLSNNETLKKLYIGPSVTALCDNLFGYCYNVDEVYSLNPVPPTCEGSSVFHSYIKSGTLYVPIGSLEAYKEAFVWKDFFNIQEMPETKCQMPTATLENGELVFSCGTEGVTFHYEYSYPEGGKGTGNHVAIGQTVRLKLYATKAGLEDSDVATYNLLIAAGSTAKKGDVNEDGSVDVADIATIITIMADN